MSQAKRIVLAARPNGEPKPSDFRLEDCPVPTPGANEILLRTIWLSLDPYMRGRMSDGPSYAAPVPIAQWSDRSPSTAHPRQVGERIDELFEQDYGDEHGKLDQRHARR